MWSRIRFFAPPEPSRPHQHARTIPQQTAIGRSVNIRLDYGGTFLLAPRPARALTPARWLVPVAPVPQCLRIRHLRVSCAGERAIWQIPTHFSFQPAAAGAPLISIL